MATMIEIDWRTKARAAYAEQQARAGRQNADRAAEHAGKALALLTWLFERPVAGFTVEGGEIHLDGRRFRAVEDDDWAPPQDPEGKPSPLRGWMLQIWRPCRACGTGGAWAQALSWWDLGRALDAPYTCEACRPAGYVADDPTTRLVAALRALLAAAPEC
jgi:hypothetical protein